MKKGPIVKSKDGIKRAPLISFIEARDKYGYTTPQLRGMLGQATHNPPKPEPQVKSAHGNYYNAANFDAWIKRVRNV